MIEAEEGCGAGFGAFVWGSVLLSGWVGDRPFLGKKRRRQCFKGLCGPTAGSRYKEPTWCFEIRRVPFGQPQPRMSKGSIKLRSSLPAGIAYASASSGTESIATRCV